MEGEERAIALHSGAGELSTGRFCDLLLRLQAEADRRKLEAAGVPDSYHYDVTQFVEYVLAGELSIVDGLEEWIADIKRTCRARTVNRKLSAVRTRILGTKRSEGLIDLLGDDLPADLRARIERTLRRIAGVTINSNAVRPSKVVDYAEDLPRLLEAINEPAVRLVVEFLARTGCRISEALGVELRRCEPEGSRCRIIIVGKGSKERECWIPGELFSRIVAHCGSERYLFEHDWKGERRQYSPKSMTTRIGRETERILGRRLSAHCLRHSWVTHLLRDRHTDVKIVSRAAGHSSVQITLDIYSEVAVTAEAVDVEIGRPA